ncbi:MAG: DUF1476 domain-containing protein [Paracoccaceae bacterium]
MTTFDDREKAFENKFIHDEEMKFKATARRNKLVGLWAAGLLGKTGAAADAYAAGLVTADLAEHGDEDLVRKLAADLGALADEGAIRARIEAAGQEARRQLMDE